MEAVMEKSTTANEEIINLFRKGVEYAVTGFSKFCVEKLRRIL